MIQEQLPFRSGQVLSRDPVVALFVLRKKLEGRRAIRHAVDVVGEPSLLQGSERQLSVFIAVLDQQNLAAVKMPLGDNYAPLPDWKPRTPRLKGYPY